MCLNPHNAVVCLGHSKGIVTMWTPNVKEPVAKMLVHRQPVTAVTIDRYYFNDKIDFE
jgi:U3 small nucleolar RNA-associated protein 7